MQRAGKGANAEAARGRAKNSARGWGCQPFTLLRAGFEPLVGVAIAADYPGPRSRVGEKVRCSIPSTRLSGFGYDLKGHSAVLSQLQPTHRGSKPARKVQEGQPNLGPAEFFALLYGFQTRPIARPRFAIA